MSRTIGIEIEGTGIYPDDCRRALQAAGVATSGRNGWKCKTDGTCGVSFEVASPALDIAGNWQETLTTVCRSLRTAGARVNRSCGIHVHVDATDYTSSHVLRLVKIWSNTEMAVNNLLSRSRQNNTFCRDNVGGCGAFGQHGIERFRGNTNAATFSNCSGGGRYRKLNLNSFSRHGTVEFRGHQGSLNATKIINWARLCNAVVEWAKGTRDVGDSEFALPETLEVLSMYAFNTDEELTGVSVSRDSDPRSGSTKASLFGLYDENATLGVREAASLAVSRGLASRKLATDTHWHWRKATTVSRTVNDTTATANADRRSSWVAYFVERAAELEIDNDRIGSDVQDTSYANN